MNASVTFVSKDSLDSKFFSQRAKLISSLNAPLATAPPKAASTPVEVRFPFSNRAYVPAADTPTTPTAAKGPVQRNSPSHEHRPGMHIGRGRTTVPLSPFVLQKDTLSSTAPVSVSATPVFVVHDEVQFVRPYFGPRRSDEAPSSTLTSHKRAVLLSALKEIESGLKTL